MEPVIDAGMDPTTKHEIICNAVANFDYIKFTIADINGVARMKIITKEVMEKFLREGKSDYFADIGQSFTGRFVHDHIPSLAKLNNGNAIMIPHLDTLHVIPGQTTDRYKMAEVYCEMVYSSTEVQASCPRFMARKQLQRLNNMGYELYSAYENEPLIVDAKTLEPLFPHGKYLSTDVGFIKNQEFIMDVAQMCGARGVKLEALHLEAVPGQLEFITMPQLGIRAADNVFAFREVLRRVATQHGKQATFMTIAFNNDTGANGFHFNHSLRSVADNKPVFYDSSKVNKLSDVCVHWVAGILKHIDALTALCCPTVNCYRRLFKDFAPNLSDWGIDDRFATVRVKNTSPGSCYVESRLPSSAANPYIVTAATVAAGIDGIINRLKCPPARSEGEKGTPLPATLGAALDALEKDTVMTDALGSEFIAWFIRLKKNEIDTLGGCEVSDVTEEKFREERELYIQLL